MHINIINSPSRLYELIVLDAMKKIDYEFTLRTFKLSAYKVFFSSDNVNTLEPQNVRSPIEILVQPDIGSLKCIQPLE